MSAAEKLRDVAFRMRTCAMCNHVQEIEAIAATLGGGKCENVSKLNSQFDVLKTAENAENVTSKNEIHNFDDTREQLEAWAHEEIAEKWAQSDREVTMIMDDLLDMLDRQAAITKNKCREEHRRRLGELHDLLDEAAREREELAWRVEYNGDLVEKVKRERNKLQHENDALKERISQSAACETAETAETSATKEYMRDFDVDTREKLEADTWHVSRFNQPTRDDANGHFSEIVKLLDRQAAITRAEVFEDGEYDCRTCDAKYELQECVDSLTAERDELQAAIDAMGNGQFYAMYREAREERDALAAKVDELNASWRKANDGLAQANADAERLQHANNTLRASVAGLKATVDRFNARDGA